MMRSSRGRFLMLAILVRSAGPDYLGASECNQAAADPITFVDVPGRPFMALPAKDGCVIFVSLENPKGGPPSGIGVLQRSRGAVSLSRVIATDGAPLGIALTRDGKLLIGAIDDRLVFLDTGRMISGEKNAVLGYLREPEHHSQLGEMKVTTPGAVYVNVALD